jgi:hypothetical protein
MARILAALEAQRQWLGPLTSAISRLKAIAPQAKESSIVLRTIAKVS